MFCVVAVLFILLPQIFIPPMSYICTSQLSYICKNNSTTCLFHCSEYRRLPQREIISMRSPLDITTYTTTQTDYCPTVHNNDDITNSVTPSAPTLNHVPPD